MPTASATTSQWTAYSPQVRIDITTPVWDAETATAHFEVYYISPSPAQATNRTWTVVIDGQTRTGNFYIGGVSGTKLMGSGDVVIQRAESVKTVQFSLTFPFGLIWSGVWCESRTCSGSFEIQPISTGTEAQTYTVTYNANGGSGAPASQTKVEDETLYLSTQTPVRVGYKFVHWEASVNGIPTGTYFDPGDAYTWNNDASMRAVWATNTVTLTYHRNGPTGTTGTTKKVTYNAGTKATILAPTEAFSTIPTYSEYAYNPGYWATIPNGRPAYIVGLEYLIDSDLDLYLIWNSEPKIPVLSNVEFQRCNSNGTATDDGTYCHITGKAEAASGSTLQSYIVNVAPYYKPGEIGMQVSEEVANGNLSGTSWTIDLIVHSSSGYMNANSAYTISLEVTSSTGNSITVGKTILKAGYIIDCYNTGLGIALLSNATKDGIYFGQDVDAGGNTIENAYEVEGTGGSFGTVYANNIIPKNNATTMNIGASSSSTYPNELTIYTRADILDRQDCVGYRMAAASWRYDFDTDAFNFLSTDSPIQMSDQIYNTTSSSDKIYIYRSGKYFRVRIRRTKFPNAVQNYVMFRVHAQFTGQAIPNTNMAVGIKWSRYSGTGADLEGLTEGSCGLGIQTNPHPTNLCFLSCSGSTVVGFTRPSSTADVTWQFSVQARTSAGQGTGNNGYFTIEQII